MRTSFFYKSVVAFLCLLGVSGTGVFSQTLGPGRHIGQSNYSNPITILELNENGKFSLSYFNVEHGGASGTGEWKIISDSLQLTFDEASLRPPDLSQKTASSWEILESRPSDSNVVSFFALDSEQLTALPGVNIGASIGDLDYNVRTDIDGKSSLHFVSDSLPDTIRVSFPGYLGIDIPTLGLGGELTEIEVILAPLMYEGPMEPFSTSKTWTFGLSLLENGDLFLANRDSSRTIRLWK